MNLRQNLTQFLVIVILFSATVSFANAQDDELSALKQKVSKLLEEDKFIDAIPSLERLVKLEPDNAEAYFHLGNGYLALSNGIRDKEAVRQTRIKARNAFVKAKALGSTNKLLDPFIASLPEDGSILLKFSSIPEAEELMLQGETAFAQGDYNEALKLYGHALELDPTIYEAALFSGDMYFRKEDFPNAEIWYQKAIAIDPERETAYRYSATPLMRQKKYDAARDRYIEAYITEPYTRLSSLGLEQWAEATGKSLGHPKIVIPVSLKDDEKGGVVINLDISVMLGANKDDGSPGWIVYGVTRKNWRTENFAKTYPNEKTYRHSLKEETDALQTTISSAVKMQKKSSSKLSPALAMLKELNDKGLLESYILLAIADQGIAADHKEYLRSNREKLRRYVLEYVIRK